MNNFKFGTDNELKMLPIIQSYFGTSIKKSDYKYSKYDFYDTETSYLFELKTRKINHNTYSTALINQCKTIYPRFIIIFCYLDGIFYIQYNKKLFDEFTIISTATQPAICIPIKHLIKLNDNEIINLEKTDEIMKTEFNYIISQDMMLQSQLK